MAKNDVNFYQSWQVNIGISVNLRNNTHRWPTEMLYVAKPDIFFQRDLNFTEFNSSELSVNLTFPKLN